MKGSTNFIERTREIDMSDKHKFFLRPSTKLLELRKGHGVSDRDFEKLFVNLICCRMKEFPHLFLEDFKECDKLKFVGFNEDEAWLEDILVNNADYIIDFYKKVELCAIAN